MLINARELRTGSNRLPPLQTLQTFSVVAETGSFTLAAEQLNLSQSAISRQIQQLELYFGCTLLERHTRKVAVSAQGQALLPLVEGLLASFKSSFEALRTQSRTLTVRMTPTFARKWLLPRLPQLRDAHPDLSINIDTAWFIRPAFGVGDIDVLITYGNGVAPGMDVVPLLEEHMTPMCAPALMETLGSPARVENLAGCTLLHADTRHSAWMTWLQAEEQYDFKPSHHQVFDTHDFALTAASSGLGVVMGDMSFTIEDRRRGELVVPFERVVSTGYGYYAFYPARNDVRRKVADFIDWLRSTCEGAENG
ncbi:MAG: LysR family transcriptional regulator [Rhizobiales bacterium]|nr:LysR family transcriptional regulator [Hyphomicrobiales bacterium]OJY02883.1 MAG: transcriptional regulator [Rhizobiales bacterium 63-22]